MQQMKSRLVGGKKGTIDAHAAERSGAHTAVRIATPGTSPVFKLDEFSRSFLHKSFNGVLIGYKVGSKNSVLRVKVEAIILAKHRRGSSLGGNRVASHGINFGNQSDRQFARHFRRRNRCAQTSATAANNNNVMSKHFGLYYPLACSMST